MKKILLLGVGLVLAAALVLVMGVVLGTAPKADAACVSPKDEPGVSANVDGLPGGVVAGYSGDQLKNAALIVNAGKRLGLSLYGQQIGVMTAMGESSLKVVGYGDAAGPDSRGLFQQRGNGSWGSYSDRMDPTISATNFFKAMMQVSGWEGLTPTEAAHRTQRNADPNHYTKYWNAAVQVVAAVSGAKVSDQPSSNPSNSDGSKVCGSHGQAGEFSGKNDYPWSDKPSWVEVGVEKATNVDTRFLYRECVDFALWRLVQQLGVANERPLPITNSSFVPGRVLGNANQWPDTWRAKGWPVENTPESGAIAWFAPGAAGADRTYGHVAVVVKVNDDGTVLLEEYNAQPAPQDHQYGQRTVPASQVSAYLHIPSSAKKVA